MGMEFTIVGSWWRGYDRHGSQLLLVVMTSGGGGGGGGDDKVRRWWVQQWKKNKDAFLLIVMLMMHQKNTLHASMLGLYNILDRYSRYLRTSTYVRKYTQVEGTWI